MEVTFKQLEKALKKSEFNQTFETLKDLVYSDLDLRVPNLEGSKLVIHNDKVTFDLNDLEIINRIALMSDSEHIKLYEKHNLFHDGGDDFDYGQSFPRGLIDLIRDIIN